MFTLYLVRKRSSTLSSNAMKQKMKEKRTNLPGSRKRGLIYFCEYCEKRFTLQYSLKKHLRTHTGERPYRCEVCDARFTQSGGLKNHVLSKHKAEQAFTCHFCGKEFPLKDRLKCHIRIHTGEKPFSCRICNKQFARNSQLSQHMKSHSVQKPFNCSLCNASFVCRTNLLNHIKRHQGAADYICDLCGKSFVRRDGLQKHLDFHADRKTSECKICNKKYKGHLMQHMRTHMKEKPHACAHCNMRFVQRSQLTVHERTHSGIRPYRCQVCHMAFSHSTALKMHIRRHTGEKPFKCLICPNKAFNQLPHLKKHMLTIHKTDKPYMCQGCRSFFKTKNLLSEHESSCQFSNGTEEKKLTNPPPMSIEKMRLLLACLFQKISSEDKLELLGYGKILIDHVLISSIENSGRKPCLDQDMDELTKLKKNIEILLEWTVPKLYMERFRREQRTVEDLLEELTS